MSQAHVLVISFPAQGNLNPLLRLAKHLASKGLLVTFSSTLYIGRRISSASTKSLPKPEDPPIAIGKGHLRFEFFTDGWDDDDPRRDDFDSFVPQLRAAGYPALVSLIRGQAERGWPISFIVNSPFLPWVIDLAEELSIPHAVLWVQSCAVFWIYYHFTHSLSNFPTVTNPDVSVNILGLPELTPDELPTYTLPSNLSKPLADIFQAQFKNVSKATWVFVNTFEELEREAIEAILTRIGLHIIPVGPLVDGPEPEIKGDLWRPADHCMDWLDLQNPNSVVYVSLGSVVVLTQGELTEMANGLVNCGQPFLLVVRENHRDLLPRGFTEEIEGRGMVVSWSSQERVLSHGSIGCFVTHCGWNSTLEVLTAGVPVVAYPQWGDQVSDAKFLVDVYGVGVRLGAPVEREELVKCVDEVMKGERAEKMKEKVVEWKEAAREAAADGGSSERNIQAFVNEIVRRAAGGGGLSDDGISRN